MKQPDYNQLLKVLRRQVPDRPVLFEFFMYQDLYDELGHDAPQENDGYDEFRRQVYAFKNAGYDYVPTQASDFNFPTVQNNRGNDHTHSLNENATITDWDSFHAYQWHNPDDFDQHWLDKAQEIIHADPNLTGLGVIAWGPCGVLENVIALVGYDNLCLLLYDDPALVEAIFEAVGSRFVRYYERAAAHPAVVALISNDDWGFKSQTLLSPADMRQYLFPWHAKIVEACGNKPVILHSCGQLKEVMDDIITMGYAAKHSYEDVIQPVEEAYDEYKERITVLGGFDVDYMCRAAPADIETRARAMLERAANDGGYALGTGNSITDFIPRKSFDALRRAAQ